MKVKHNGTPLGWIILIGFCGKQKVRCMSLRHSIKMNVRSLCRSTFCVHMHSSLHGLAELCESKKKGISAIYFAVMLHLHREKE